MIVFLLLGLASLGVLALVASILGRTLRTREQDPAPRALAGVLAVLGLGAVGFLSLGAVGLAGLGFLGSAAVRFGPVRSVEVVRAADPLDLGAAPSSDLERDLLRQASASGRLVPSPADPHPLHLFVDWEGRVEPERVERLLRREFELDVELIGAERVREGGDVLTRLHFGLDVDRRDLADLELALQGVVTLPDRVRFEVRR